MKKFLLAPDSFKGTLTASEVCEIEKSAILEVYPDASVVCVPMADGGEGMAESYRLMLGGEKIIRRVTGPLGDPVDAGYTMLPGGMAVMEMAAAAGLPLTGGRRCPLRASTFGVGEMLLDARGRRAAEVLLGLGGSATNDCGIGMAAALGYRFLDSAGRVVEPLAANLGRIDRIVPPESDLNLRVTAACDVNNPLLGPEGATYVFGPQKGVTEDVRPLLEAAMARFSKVLEQTFRGFDPYMPGTGAAGGMGAAVSVFLNASLEPGIDMLLDAIGFDRLAGEADIIVTGEGRMDAQSLRGKVSSGVGFRAMKAGRPCFAICGSLGKGAELLSACGITASYAASEDGRPFDDIAKTCREDLRAAAMRFLADL